MKTIVVSVAGLGWDELVRRGATRIAGLDFRPVDSVFPAVTCVAQATLRTGENPASHGMVSNGWFCRETRKPSFWEQSAGLVSGSRVWAAARAAGRKVGMFFFQQSVGESVDALVSPAHIHKHGGGSILYRYGQPVELGEALDKANGKFPLWRYWGPLAHPKAGDACVRDFISAARLVQLDIAFLYLPTLDYDAQRHGPEDPRCDKAFAFVVRQLETLARFAEKESAQLHVFGEYGIEKTSSPPVFPNAILRKASLFATRPLGGRAYPDIPASRAFAMCDHEVAHVYVRDPGDVGKVRDILIATGAFESVLERSGGGDWAHSQNAGELLLVAKPGSWCDYRWWENRSEAPDYATHIDIHNKPGYDPCELFFDRGPWLHPRTCQDPSRIRGSHGRRCTVAVASSSMGKIVGSTFAEVASSLRAVL